MNWYALLAAGSIVDASDFKLPRSVFKHPIQIRRPRSGVVEPVPKLPISTTHHDLNSWRLSSNQGRPLLNPWFPFLPPSQTWHDGGAHRSRQRHGRNPVPKRNHVQTRRFLVYGLRELSEVNRGTMGRSGVQAGAGRAIRRARAGLEL
jgi:hypothetical protein